MNAANLKAGTFCLNGYIDVPAERLASIETALQTHISLTRKEAGCIYFNVDACNEVSGRFLVSEAFVDEAAFNAHQERAGTSDWAEASKEIPRSYKTWVIG